MALTNNQPSWKLIANLGDVNPLDHGGYFVYQDTTGVYAPEAELLQVPDDDRNDDREEVREYVIYRFALEPCTYIDGVLSDNKYHPELSAWFAKPERERANRPQDTTYLSDVARSVGTGRRELIRMFLSTDILERAEAWRMIGEYHGFDNLDSYPVYLNRREAELRYQDQ